jgi:hypothetical protein
MAIISRLTSLLLLLLLPFPSIASHFSVSYFPILPDSIDIVKLEIDLFRKYGIVLPKHDTCRYNTATPDYVKLSLPSDIELKDKSTKLDHVAKKVTVDYDVLKSGKPIVSFHATDWTGATMIYSKVSWTGNWALAYPDHIIINSRDIDTLYGYTRSYELRIKRKGPAYFFEKEGKSFLHVDSTDVVIDCTDVLHYKCCGYGMFNPAFADCWVSFYARRGGWWCYCTVKQDNEP